MWPGTNEPSHLVNHTLVWITSIRLISKHLLDITPNWRGQVLLRARRENLSMGNHLHSWPIQVQANSRTAVHTASLNHHSPSPFPQWFPHFLPLPSASPTSSLSPQRHRHDHFARGGGGVGRKLWESASPPVAAWPNCFQALLIKINCPGMFSQRKQPKLQDHGRLQIDVPRAASEN